MSCCLFVFEVVVPYEFLHFVCVNSAYGAPVEVVAVLIECWEEGMAVKDSQGRNALHFAMVSSSSNKVYCRSSISENAKI